MKKAFIYILLFYYLTHFLIPGAYFLFSGGDYSTYTEVNDNATILKGFLINSVTIILSIFTILILPDRTKNAPIKAKFYSLTPLFYLSILFSIFYFFIRGGFEGRLTNNMAGSLFSYISLFLNSNMILLCILFYQRKPFNLVILFFIYLIYTTLTGSRSGFLSLLIIFLIYPAFHNFQLYKKSIKRVLLSLAIISPVLFIVATMFIRDVNVSLSTDFIMRLIMGRLSFLETSMLPIHYNDLGDSLDLFYKKYGLLNQIKLIIDTLFPGNLFSPDVMPNQYYRACFMGYSEAFVIDVYTSINITLPIYLYMYFGSFFACIIGAVVIVTYYSLCSKFRNNVFLFVPLLSTLYMLLVFFDWTLWFLQFFTFALTALSIYLSSVLRKAFFEMIRKEKPTLIA